jgi:hypothetical protein
LARCEFLTRKENILLLGNSGTGKTHIVLALGLAACQRGHRVRFITAAALVGELIEARDEKYLRRFQKQLTAHELLIIDELGYVPLSKAGAELLFETISQRYERSSTLITSDLPFDEWTEIFGSERLAGALLDRITHHVHILEMNADSYRLKQSRRKRVASSLLDRDGSRQILFESPPLALAMRLHRSATDPHFARTLQCGQLDLGGHPSRQGECQSEVLVSLPATDSSPRGVGIRPSTLVRVPGCGWISALPHPAVNGCAPSTKRGRRFAGAAPQAWFQS